MEYCLSVIKLIRPNIFALLFVLPEQCIQKQQNMSSEGVILKQSEIKWSIYFQIRNYRPQSNNWSADMITSYHIQTHMKLYAWSVMSSFCKKVFPKQFLKILLKFLHFWRDFWKALFLVMQNTIFVWTEKNAYVWMGPEMLQLFLKCLHCLNVLCHCLMKINHRFHI